MSDVPVKTNKQDLRLIALARKKSISTNSLTQNSKEYLSVNHHLIATMYTQEETESWLKGVQIPPLPRPFIAPTKWMQFFEDLDSFDIPRLARNFTKDAVVKAANEPELIGREAVEQV
jgi:hypothetical protein